MQVLSLTQRLSHLLSLIKGLPHPLLLLANSLTLVVSLTWTLIHQDNSPGQSTDDLPDTLEKLTMTCKFYICFILLHVLLILHLQRFNLRANLQGSPPLELHVSISLILYSNLSNYAYVFSRRGSLNQVRCCWFCSLLFTVFAAGALSHPCSFGLSSYISEESYCWVKVQNPEVPKEGSQQHIQSFLDISTSEISSTTLSLHLPASVFIRKSLYSSRSNIPWH